MAKKAFLVSSLLLLGGCSSITPQGQSNAPGQAAYYLQKGQDGSCTVRITSGREVEAGKVSIGPDCTVQAEAANLSGKEAQAQMLQVIQGLLEKLP